MFDSQVVAFTVVAAVLTLTPGADTMLVLRNVLRGSRRAGIVTTFGICSGLFFHAALSALGVSIILMHSAALFHTVKMIGACYLVWLGLQSIRAAIRGGDDEEPSGGRGIGSSRKYFVEGFLNNVLNPKVAVFYLAFLPQFISPDDPVVTKSMLLAGIHFVMGIAWLVFLSGFVDRARRFIIRSSVRKWLEGICGAVLIGLGARLALEQS